MGDTGYVGEAWAQWLSPLFAFVVFGVIVLFMRWTFSASRRREPTTHHDAPSNYGLLRSVRACATRGSADALVLLLAGHGIRASAVDTAEGPHVMVFPTDVNRALRVIDDAGPPQSWGSPQR